MKGATGLKRLVVRWSQNNFDWTNQDEVEKYARIKGIRKCGKRSKSDLDTDGVSVWEEKRMSWNP